VKVSVSRTGGSAGFWCDGVDEHTNNITAKGALGKNASEADHLGVPTNRGRERKEAVKEDGILDSESSGLRALGNRSGNRGGKSSSPVLTCRCRILRLPDTPSKGGPDEGSAVNRGRSGLLNEGSLGRGREQGSKPNLIHRRRNRGKGSGSVGQDGRDKHRK